MAYHRQLVARSFFWTCAKVLVHHQLTGVEVVNVLKGFFRRDGGYGSYRGLPLNAETSPWCSVLVLANARQKSLTNSLSLLIQTALRAFDDLLALLPRVAMGHGAPNRAEQAG